MSPKKIIAVFGATGAQGGGVANAILNDPNSEFSVRAITRDVNSEKAKELARQGAELVSADIDDPASMHKALEGAYGAYLVTFFWSHFSAEKEMTEAQHMAEAAKAAGLQHVIWSTLEDTRKWVPLDDDRMPTLMGNYKVPHFDGKGEADKYFTDLGVPTTFLRASFYWDNFIYFGAGPKKGPDGKLYLTFPLDDKKMAGIAAEDIGKCA
ncbi:MAG TPA: NmrA/HSCARG family protein, partial [Chitinophagaceae bacterium]|nr:NmrA/HSCARG family protein [Chitinophagaceae bacterium]